MPARTIQRMPYPGRREFYRRVVSSGEPVIFTGSVDSWKAFKRWTFDWFVQTHGDEKIPVEWLTYVLDPTGTGAARRGRRVEMPLRDYIASLAQPDSSQCGYLIGMEMLQRLPALLADLEFPAVQANEKLTRRLFFMGARGAYTQLHFDRADNLHAMLQGRKRWQLFAPDKTRALEPIEPGFVWSVLSRLDLGNEHMRPLEELGAVPCDYDLVLEQGEALYLPYGWWHRVLSEEATISTNLWWWTYGMLLRLIPVLIPAASRIEARKWVRRRRERQPQPGVSV